MPLRLSSGSSFLRNMPCNPMTIRQAINTAAERIESRWPETPYLDAQVILAWVLKTSREKLLASLGDEISQSDCDTLMQKAALRVSGYPVAYITHHQEFYALDFYVDSNVLTPRADTEILVETALKHIHSGTRVLDLCTGSGCIAIAIKYNVPEAIVHASDISDDALAVFRRNAESILSGHLMGQILTHKSDLLNSIDGKYDVIVSNPPYLTRQTASSMAQDGWPEPRIALDGGNDGLDLIRQIIREAPGNLNPGGHLLLEADPDQMTVIKNTLEKYKYNDIIISKDLAGRDRVIAGCYSG